MTRAVVHFVDSEIFGGAEESALHLLAGLDRARWRPFLLHHGEPDISRLVEAARRLGVATHLVPRMTDRNALVTVPRFLGALRTASPAVFHAHLSWPLACKYGVLAAALGRVPVVVGTAQLFCEVTAEPFGRRQQRLVTALVDRYIAVSHEVERRYRDDLGVPGRKLEVVPNGIPLERFRRPPDPGLRAALRNGRPGRLVLTPARLHAQKGHVYLLEAASRVPDATFVLAGDGPERNQLERRAAELGVSSRVVFLGQREDVPGLLASCDVFVLPSLYEGFPLSVLEAMAAGIPVIATAIGGTDEAVRHEEHGLLVPPRDPAALAAAIRRLLDDPALASRLAAGARARVESEFSAAAMARGVGRIYYQLLASRGAPNATPA